MVRRFLTGVATEGILTAVGDGELRRWAGNFPPNVARRMTRLGLLLGHVWREFSAGPEDAVVYASTYGEAGATERYLASLPAASPLLFQTSIHPSAIEQVLINRGCPVEELTPLAGHRWIASEAVVTALLTPAARVFLTGGEEIGGWLREVGASSTVAFAFTLRLERDPGPGAAVLAELVWTPPAPGSPHPHAPPGDRALGTVAAGETGAVTGEGGLAVGPDDHTELRAFFVSLQARRTVRWPVPAGGECLLRWF